MKIASLEKVLAYRNQAVLDRFVEKFPVAESEAEEIFRETLKMIWLMAIRKEECDDGLITSPTKIIVYNPMAVLDEMWHNFILFTAEYIEFSKEHFGYYLHHAPTTAADREREHRSATEDPAGHETRFAQEVQTQCRYIAAKLGVETLTKWFKIFPTHFPSFTTPSHLVPRDTAAGWFANS